MPVWGVNSEAQAWPLSSSSSFSLLSSLSLWSGTSCLLDGRRRREGEGEGEGGGALSHDRMARAMRSRIGNGMPAWLAKV